MGHQNDSLLLSVRSHFLLRSPFCNTTCFILFSLWREHGVLKAAFTPVKGFGGRNGRLPNLWNEWELFTSKSLWLGTLEGDISLTLFTWNQCLWIISFKNVCPSLTLTMGLDAFSDKQLVSSWLSAWFSFHGTNCCN